MPAEQAASEHDRLIVLVGSSVRPHHRCSRAGRDATLGALTERSAVPARLPPVHDGQPVRFLKSVDVRSVDPVLKGAGVQTRTVAVNDRAPEVEMQRELLRFTQFQLREFEAQERKFERKRLARVWDRAVA